MSPLRHLLKIARLKRVNFQQVPEEGLEPSSLARHDFESCAYTNSATPAISLYFFIYYLSQFRLLTGAVHLLDFSEKTSKGLAVWLPLRSRFPYPHLTPAIHSLLD